MRSWYENEELLKRFREWLGRTESEIAALGLAGTFDDAADDALPDAGLIQLIEAFTALRQEIKLQTKSNRGLEDAVQEALAGLDEAAEQMRSVEAREAESAARAARPLVDALIELDEALERGLRAARTAHANLLDDAVRRYEQAAQQRFDRLSAWQRWKSRGWFEKSVALFQEQTTDLHRRIMLPLLEGYQLIYQRLERTLGQVGIERIDCLGQPVDPTRMTVVELVDDPTVDPETVVGLVRPGYEWRGRLIRYAEVRAARQNVSQGEEEAYEEEDEFEDRDAFEKDREQEETLEDEYEDEHEDQDAHAREVVEDRGREGADDSADEDEHDEEDDREVRGGYEAREQAVESEGVEKREPEVEEHGYEEEVHAVVIAGMEEREPLDEHASVEEHEREAEPESKVEHERGREAEQRDEETRTTETEPDPQADAGRETEIEPVDEQERIEDPALVEGQELGEVRERSDEQHVPAKPAFPQHQDFPEQQTNPEQCTHADGQESQTQQVCQESHEHRETERYREPQWFPEPQWSPGPPWNSSTQVDAEPRVEQEPRERLDDPAESQNPPPPERHD